MPRAKQAKRPKRPDLLQGLKRYTRSEVAAVNFYASLFNKAAPWKLWIEETCSNLLKVSQGFNLSLIRSSELQNEEVQTYEFAQDVITIGRAAENDISLPVRSISRAHARIVREENGSSIEDLQSASGTYVNRQKLEPGHRRRLQSGDEFLAFPYLFRVKQQEVWGHDSEIALEYEARFTPSPASSFVDSLGVDICLFQLALHPDMGHAILALSRPFLMTMLSRLTRDTVAELADSDAGLLEFIVLSTLERANRELKFPFQCSLVQKNQFALKEEPGVILAAALRMTGAQGRLLLFLPESCLRQIQKDGNAERSAHLRRILTLRLAVRLGFATVSTNDLQDLKPGDTLLYTEQIETVLPRKRLGGASEHGWSLARDEEEEQRFKVRNVFERSLKMQETKDLSEELEATSEVDLASIRVCIHVVLNEMEMSLHDIERLGEGSVVELDETPEQVQLVLNGNVVGAGVLVNIEDRLGVEITRWRKA